MIYDPVQYEECDAGGCNMIALEAVSRLLEEYELKLVFVPTGGSWYRFFIGDLAKEYIMAKIPKEDE